MSTIRLNPKLFDAQNWNTSEQKIGKWNNENLYCKMIYVSSIDCTTASFKYVDHGITNLKYCLDIRYTCGVQTVGASTWIQTFNNVLSAIAINSTQIRFWTNAWDTVPHWYFYLIYTKN